MIEVLEAKLQDQTDARERVDSLNDLARELWQIDPRRALDLAEEAAEGARALSYRKGLAFGLQIVAFCQVMMANNEVALEHGLQALQMFEELDDPLGEAHALRTIGLVYYHFGDYERALECCLKALELSRSIHDCSGEALSLNTLGQIYEHLDDYEQALTCFTASLEIYEVIGDRWGSTSPLSNIGVLYDKLGDYEQALTYYLESLDISRQTGNRWREAAALCNIGLTYDNLGRYRQALEYATAALPIFENMGEKRGLAVTYINIGIVYSKTGESDRARDHFLQGLTIAEETGNKWLQTEALLGLGKLYCQQGEAPRALGHLHRALSLAKQINKRSEVYKVHRILSDAYKIGGDFQKALEHYEQFHEIEKEIFNEESNKKLRSLQVRFELEQANKAKEIYRLKYVELAQALAELQALNESLQEADRQKSQLLAQLEKQAMLLERQTKEDGLTGLYNRRYLDLRLAEEFQRARRYGRALSVAICDVDTFKDINDQFSHHIGDETLKAIARIFKANLRATDIIARYGGEEFVFVLPETVVSDAALVCEKIRRAIAEYNWQTIHPDLKVTVSIGLSADLDVSRYEKMLSAADARLYEAKQNGRNQVRC